MKFTEILYEKSEGVALITFNRPHRGNAMTLTSNNELQQAIEEAAGDSSVGAIVITGAGKAFCTGMDVEVLGDIAEAGRIKGNPGDAGPGETANLQAMYGYMLRTPKPIVGAIKGNCLGMGLCMALHFDIRIAGESARMSTMFVRRGLSAELGSHWTLPRLVGVARALELALTGRMVGAHEAAQMGLVNRVVADDQVLPCALEMARDMAVNCSAMGMAEAKRLIWQDLAADYEAATNQAYEVMLKMFKWGDFKEAMKAFTEKRPPRFRPL
jgi:enoyl-CoA hydratase/carnithine racemase